MRAASVDIGTNSVLLLVAETVNERLSVLDELHAIPRLGTGVDKEKNLHPDSQQRVIDVLKKYHRFLSDRYPDVLEDVIVTTTSAVRDANNREAFLSRIYQATGWGVRLLSGREEAETTFAGALSVLEFDSEIQNIVLDIGGGSTEIARGRGVQLMDAVSINMGSVRFSERFLKENPPDPQQIEKAREGVRRLLAPLFRPEKPFRAVGVAGTVTSLASVSLNIDEYAPHLLNGYHLKQSAIQAYIALFSTMSANEIENQYPAFLTGRGDVILAGLLILDEFLEWCDADEMTVSTGGIRHGVILDIPKSGL